MSGQKENDEHRRKRLRHLLAGEKARVDLGDADLRWLLDEVSRLQQSNDRLRRQNRKLRLRRGDGGDEIDVAGGPAPEQ